MAYAAMKRSLFNQTMIQVYENQINVYICILKIDREVLKCRNKKAGSGNYLR